jgi:hypothetical protein
MMVRWRVLLDDVTGKWSDYYSETPYAELLQKCNTLEQDAFRNSACVTTAEYSFFGDKIIIQKSEKFCDVAKKLRNWIETVIRNKKLEDI